MVGHDPHPVPVEVEGRRDADGLRRHRVADAVEQHPPRRSHTNGESEWILSRSEGEWAQARPLLDDPRRGGHSRCPTRANLVHLVVPLRELRLEVGPIVEASDQEEVLLGEPDQVLDGALLLAPPRRAELRDEPVVERDLSEGVVPLDLVAVAGDDDRLRVVEDAGQGHTPEGVEGAEEGSDERLDLLVGDKLDVDPSGPLQAAREEVDGLSCPVVVADTDRAEVVLAELTRQPLEANHRRRNRVPQSANHLVDGVLAAGVARLRQATKDLHRREAAVLREDLLNRSLEGIRDRRAAHRAPRWRIDGAVAHDTHDRPKTDVGPASHLSKGEASSA